MPDRDDDPDGRPRRRRFEDDDRDDRRRRRPPPEGNGVATAALVLGILGLCGGLTALPAVVCGAIGLSRANRRGGAGQGMAIAGLVLGALGLVFVPVLIGLLLPAVQKVRDAAGRAQSQNNMKRIALGFHNYEAVYGRMTGPYVEPEGAAPPADPARRLSWRVNLLPFIEQENVYRQLKLDQPWDGPANLPAARTPIPTYSDPGGQPSDQTRYRVFVGGGALFDPAPDPANPRGLAISGIPDGASNTVFAVEAGGTVPWAQSNELPFAPAGPLPPLGRPGSRTFNVAMADGSVRAVRADVNPQVLKAAITRAGGEPPPPGGLD